MKQNNYNPVPSIGDFAAYMEDEDDVKFDESRIVFVKKKYDMSKVIFST